MIHYIHHYFLFFTDNSGHLHICCSIRISTVFSMLELYLSIVGLW